MRFFKRRTTRVTMIHLEEVGGRAKTIHRTFEFKGKRAILRSKIDYRHAVDIKIETGEN